MYRQNGPIPPIQKSRLPKRLIIFDTEAYRSGFDGGVEVQSLRLGVARFLDLSAAQEILSDEYFNFNTVEMLMGFIEWHTRKDKSLYVYAHNLKYDLQLSGLYTSLLSQGWETTLFVTEDPPSFIRLRFGRQSIILVDTFNYWQFSLAKMGEQLGLQKLPMPDVKTDDREWFTYCKRDVEVLSQYLLEFITFLEGNDLAGLGLTVASQAFRSYRHRFMEHEIIIHSDRRALFLERDGYSGGRVEAFFIGQLSGQPLYKLDVNSMYPFVMKEHAYPTRLVSYSEVVPLKRLENLLARYYVLADCTLNVNQPAYALKHNHKLIFPIGSFQTVLHPPELIYALVHKEVIRVNRLALYDRQPIFDGYVDYFYQVKLEAIRQGDKIQREQAKLFLNSLYGKFGQREVVSKIVANPGEYQFSRITGYSESLDRSVEVNYLGNKIELRYSGGESAYSFPAIAGGVTAYARMYLWELIEAAGKLNVFYCDTDSLVTNQAGFERLTPYLDPNRLGALKLEGESQSLLINGAKDYVFGSEIKHKGLPKSALQLNDNLWEYDQFRGFKTWIKDGLKPGVEVYKRQKERIGVYDKGTILPDGSVIPLRLDGG